MKKVAIVTAASKGMGRACAYELHNRGYALSLMSRGDEIDGLGEELEALTMKGSVTSADDLSNLVKATNERYGKIDAVVNNTGHPAKGPLLSISDQEWHDGMDLILLNVIRMARLVVPYFKSNGGGSIVNISTFAAFEPSLSFPVSSAMRAALAGFTKLFSDEYGTSGIRMNNVLPGFINSYPVDEDVLERIPLKRQGKIEEIAKTTAFLLSSDAEYITGQNIRVDGGISRSIG